MAPRAASPPCRTPDVDQEEPPRGRKRRRNSAGLQLASKKQMSTLRGRARHRSLSILERNAIQDPSNSNSDSEEEIDDATMKMAGIAAGVVALAAVHKRTAGRPAQRAAMLPHVKKLADGLVALANSTSMEQSDSNSDSDSGSSKALGAIGPAKLTQKKGKHQPATSHPFQYPLSSASGNENPVKIKKKRRSQSPSRSRSRNGENRGTPRPRRRQRTQSRSRRHE